MPDYELRELYEATKEARSERNREVPWTLFKEAYGEHAADHFLQALENGDIEVVEARDGIRMDGSWPKYHTGRLVYDVIY